MANITFAAGQTEISVNECSTCHRDVTFDASSVNRNETCDAKCHGSPVLPMPFHTNGRILTEYGWFKSVSSSTATAPYVHDSAHEDTVLGPQSCNTGGCHITHTCSNCHDSNDVFHVVHGSNNTNPAYACGSELCHNLTINPRTDHVDSWTIDQPKPACENCHNDQSIPLHNITTLHQSDLIPECQTCHSSYLPDTHAKIANESYSSDSCAVCHQSTNETVMSAITNNDTSCASCHTLHDDITDSHTTTEGSGCMNCHSNQYLPDLHNNVGDFDTNCSVCHNNELIPTLPDTVECNECHGGGTLFPAHKNRENPPSSYTELTDMSSGRWSR